MTIFFFFRSVTRAWVRRFANKKTKTKNKLEKTKSMPPFREKPPKQGSGQLIDAKYHNSFPLYRKNRQFARGKGGNPVDGAWG
jgi:hypothetical protein